MLESGSYVSFFKLIYFFNSFEVKCYFGIVFHICSKQLKLYLLTFHYLSFIDSFSFNYL